MRGRHSLTLDQLVDHALSELRPGPAEALWEALAQVVFALHLAELREPNHSDNEVCLEIRHRIEDLLTLASQRRERASQASQASQASLDRPGELAPTTAGAPAGAGGTGGAVAASSSVTAHSAAGGGGCLPTDATAASTTRLTKNDLDSPAVPAVPAATAATATETTGVARHGPRLPRDNGFVAELSLIGRQMWASNAWIEPSRDELDPAWSGTEGSHELWERLHLATLRLSSTATTEWRTKLCDAALRAGEDIPDAHLAWLIPPSSAAGSVGLPGVSEGGIPHPDVAEAFTRALTSRTPFEPELRAYVGLLSDVLDVAGRDRSLLLALRSVSEGLERLDNPEIRQKLVSNALDRVDDLLGRADSAAGLLWALVRLDEVLASVLHVPVAAPSSWWQAVYNNSREIVRHVAVAVPGAQVVAPSGNYLTARKQTKADLPVSTGGEGGRVLHVLRLWLREPSGQPNPGRVIYTDGGIT